MSTLRSRLAAGARWTVAVRVVDRAIGLVSTLVLVRLLAPGDFGVVAMGTAIQGILATLTEFGFTKAIIRIRRPQHAHYSTAFTLNAMTSATVALVMLATIPIATAWYEDPRVVPVMVTLAAMNLLGGLRNLGLARYERAMAFRPFFLIALARKVSSFIVGIAAALIWRDYSALLAGMLAGTIVEIGATYRLTNFRPRFTLSRSRELLGFSVWWLASEMITMLGRRGQDVFVGQELGASTLGKYAVALDLATLPTTEIVAPVMRAVYPGYVQMKDEVGRLYAAFVNVWGVVALLAIPSSVGIACLADPITSIVLGEKWAGAAPLIRVLAAVGAMQALHACYWPIMLTRLGPKTVFNLALWSVMLTLPVFVILLWTSGLLVAIGGSVVCGLVMLVVGARLLVRDLGYRVMPLITGLVRPVLGSMIMATAVLYLVEWLPAAQSWTVGIAVLLISMLAGLVVYASAIWGLWWVSGRPVSAERELWKLVIALPTSARR
jgi:lipopolysaccharide exporter